MSTNDDMELELSDSLALPASAVSELSLVAEGLDRVSRPGAAAADDDESGGIGMRANDPLRLMVVVVFSVVVFGSAIALNAFALYVGLANVGEPCNKPLAAWAIVNGILGMVTAVLLIVVSFPKGENARASTGEVQTRFLGNRVNPPVFARNRSESIASRILIGTLGLAQFLALLWFLVGSALAVQAEESECPSLLYKFCFYFVIALWCLGGLSCVISCILAVVRESKRKKERSGGPR